MTRGTTPTHTFKLPVDGTLIENAMVIYAQNGAEVFHKEKYECEIEGNTLSVKLDQEDTLKLSHLYNVQIQLRILTIDGVAMASYPAEVRVGVCLNDEVL